MIKNILRFSVVLISIPIGIIYGLLTGIIAIFKAKNTNKSMNSVKVKVRSYLEEPLNRMQIVCPTIHQNISVEMTLYVIKLSEYFSKNKIHRRNHQDLLIYIFGKKSEHVLKDNLITISNMEKDEIEDIIESVEFSISLDFDSEQVIPYDQRNIDANLLVSSAIKIQSMIEEEEFKSLEKKYISNEDNDNLCILYRKYLSKLNKDNLLYNSTNFYINNQNIIECYCPEYSLFATGMDCHLYTEKYINKASRLAAPALETGNYPDAAHYLSVLKNSGDLAAKYNLALLHFNGLFYKESKEMSFKIMEECAKNGFPKAKYHLGRMYYSGEGVTENEAMGIGWILASLPESLSGDAENERDEFLLSYFQLNRLETLSVNVVLDNISNQYTELAKEIKKHVSDEKLFTINNLINKGINLPINLVSFYGSYVSALNQLGQILRIEPHILHLALTEINDIELNSPHSE